MPHQHPGVAQLSALRVGALFWDPGVGKTRAMIEVIARRQERLSRVVWFAPVAAKITIRNEWLKHTTLPPEQVHVFGERTRPGRLPDAAVHIVGAESLSSSDRVALAVYELLDPDTLIVFDESDLFRSVQALRFRRAELFARRVGHRFLLTGTPANEGVADLYGQMRLLDPGILGYSSWYQFCQAHLVFSEEHQDRIISERDAELVTARMAPYVSRAEKGDLRDLPPKLYDNHCFELTRAQEEAYAQAKEELLPADDDPTLTDVRRLFTALQGIAAGYWNRRDPETGAVRLHTYPHRRLELLEHVLGQLPGERVVVWCKYARSVEQVRTFLVGQGATVAEYHGGTPERARSEELRRFQSGEAQYLIGTPGTGGRGLNELVGASYAVFYESSFKARERVQAENRLHRLTTRAPVTLIDLIADCPIERLIHRALGRKEDASMLLLRQLRAARREGGKEKAQQVLGEL